MDEFICSWQLAEGRLLHHLEREVLSQGINGLETVLNTRFVQVVGVLAAIRTEKMARNAYVKICERRGYKFTLQMQL